MTMKSKHNFRAHNLVKDMPIDWKDLTTNNVILPKGRDQLIDEREVDTNDYFRSVNHFVFFCLNYPPTFLEAWPKGNVRDHIECKLKSISMDICGYGLMVKFWTDLDQTNRKIFAKWIMANFKGQTL